MGILANSQKEYIANPALKTISPNIHIVRNPLGLQTFIYVKYVMELADITALAALGAVLVSVCPHRDPLHKNGIRSYKKSFMEMGR